MLRIIYPDQSSLAPILLETIIEDLIANKNYQKIMYRKAKEKLAESNNQYFRARSGQPNDSDYDICFTRMGDYEFDNLIVSTKKHQDFDFWKALVPKLNIDNKLVQAHVFDEEYWLEQNTDSLENYKILFGENSHLKIIPSNNPYPLPAFKIDTRDNPSRIVFFTGYMQAVSAQLWLGEPFFNISNISYANLLLKLSATKNVVFETHNHLLYIESYHQLFTDNTTADTQNSLRKLIFI